MTADTDDLLERLARGEVGAAEELFTAYAPYLRAVVRRQMASRLRAKFDSADVVQSVWVQVVRQLRRDGWRVGTEAELRALLATIARRRLIGRVRKDGRAADAETPDPVAVATAPAHGEARPSQAAQAGDLWDKLLRLCPPEHHAVLRLRWDGLQLAEIAARTGLHEGSVRRILRNLFRDLARTEGGLPDGPPDETATE